MQAKIERILKAACKKVGLAREKIELSVNIVGSKKMRQLNRRWRGEDKSTDVLSFPIGVEYDMLYLGDIFINSSDAKKNLPFLVVHGFLHLFGYDHERSKREARIMFALQNEIINNLRG